jgi:hypothetical protein
VRGREGERVSVGVREVGCKRSCGCDAGVWGGVSLTVCVHVSIRTGINTCA